MPEEQLEKSVKAFRENLSNSTIERYTLSIAFLYIRALQLSFLYQQQLYYCMNDKMLILPAL